MTHMLIRQKGQEKVALINLETLISKCSVHFSAVRVRAGVKITFFTSSQSLSSLIKPLNYHFGFLDVHEEAVGHNGT